MAAALGSPAGWVRYRVWDWGTGGNRNRERADCRGRGFSHANGSGAHMLYKRVNITKTFFKRKRKTHIQHFVYSSTTNIFYRSIYKVLELFFPISRKTHFCFSQTNKKENRTSLIKMGL